MPQQSRPWGQCWLCPGASPPAQSSPFSHAAISMIQELTIVSHVSSCQPPAGWETYQWLPRNPCLAGLQLPDTGILGGRSLTWLVCLDSLRMARALPPLNSISPVYDPPMLASASAAKSTTWGGSMMSPVCSSRGSVETTTLHRCSLDERAKGTFQKNPRKLLGFRSLHRGS